MPGRAFRQADQPVEIILNHINELSINDRIYLTQAIWDSIAAERLKLTPEQAEELDRRSAAYDASPENVMTWEDIAASISTNPKFMEMIERSRADRSKGGLSSQEMRRRLGLE